MAEIDRVQVSEGWRELHYRPPIPRAARPPLFGLLGYGASAEEVEVREGAVGWEVVHGPEVFPQASRSEAIEHARGFAERYGIDDVIIVGREGLVLSRLTRLSDG